MDLVLLNFEGDKEIIEVDINNPQLAISRYSSERGESGIEGTVDILCTNKGRQRIAIEMQGQKARYLLPREQLYMAKLIAGQPKEGGGKEYHEQILETHMIVIGKRNLFAGDTAIKDQTLFELDIYPTIKQTQEPMPQNKMFWKFFELQKFTESPGFAHNLDFDLSMLIFELRRVEWEHRFSYPANWIDTVPLSGGLKLRVWAEQVLGVGAGKQKHRALSDAQMLLKCWRTTLTK